MTRRKRRIRHLCSRRPLAAPSRAEGRKSLQTWWARVGRSSATSHTTTRAEGLAEPGAQRRAVVHARRLTPDESVWTGVGQARPSRRTATARATTHSRSRPDSCAESQPQHRPASPHLAALRQSRRSHRFHLRRHSHRFVRHRCPHRGPRRRAHSDRDRGRRRTRRDWCRALRRGVAEPATRSPECCRWAPVVRTPRRRGERCPG